MKMKSYFVLLLFLVLVDYFRRGPSCTSGAAHLARPMSVFLQQFAASSLFCEQKFRKEDKQHSGTDAYARRSAALQKAEQKAREESEQLRLQERENMTEKRRRDLTLRARVAAKAEQKKLELLFLQWSEHQKKLSNFIRTKAEPQIYYALVKPLEEDTSKVEQQKEQTFSEWKVARRQEVSEYQKEIEEQYLGNVEKERWQDFDWDSALF